MMQLIRTMHSDYVLDTEAMTLRRRPREEEANQLRSDGETVQLLEILTLQVGVMAEFMIQLPGVGVTTYRRTTAVIDITEIDEGSTLNAGAGDTMARNQHSTGEA